jgi:hypothetical protein
MRPRTFVDRRNEWTPEQLKPYEGKFVAWSMDAERILAAAICREYLDAELRRLGITEYVEDYIPTPEEVQGGFW